MGLNVFDIINAVLGVVSALVPLVQVPLAIKADRVRMQQPTKQEVHYISRKNLKRR